MTNPLEVHSYVINIRQDRTELYDTPRQGCEHNTKETVGKARAEYDNPGQEPGCVSTAKNTQPGIG